MDPVTIIGLVAAIIALADKTTQISKALLSCKEVDRKLAQLFSRLTKKLPLLRIILEEIEKSAHQAEQSGNSSIHQQETLETTLEDCKDRFSKLSKALEAIQPNGKKSLITRLDRLFSDKTKVDEITDLTSILVDGIDTLARYQLSSYIGRTDLYTVI
jgi:chromosome segregation ATPase